MDSGITPTASRGWCAARLLLTAIVIAATFAIGTSPVNAWTNYCTDESPPPAGPDFGIDIGPGVAYLGVTLGHGTPTSGSGDPAVCVNNETFAVHFTAVGGTYAWVNHCTGGPCTVTLGNTGLVGSLAPTTVTGSTTVCVGICVTTPFIPIKADTGYDVYVAGTKVADLCIAAATTC
jgi:hypothetical protein